MAERARVFISYAHRDGAELARKLRDDLVTRKYEAWLDEARLQGGSNWSSEIEQELDSCDVVLALLSAGSFESEVCRGEQLRSLRRSQCLIPVLVHPNADRPVYLEARQFRDLSELSLYSLRLEDLIRDIDTRSGARLAASYRETRYDTVPPLPTNFLARPAELEALRQAVLNDRERQSVALVALKGMGGIGKTVLAQALCRDEAVQAAFPDGIIWLKIGEKPTDADLIGQMHEAARVLGKSSEGFETLDVSSNLLRTHLADKAALLVLDDVWKAEHVYRFQPTEKARACRLLFTTRNGEIAKATGAGQCPLDVLADAAARRLLANYAGVSEPSLPPEAAGIVRECRGLPLALAIVGAMLHDEPPPRWADVLDSLRHADLAEIALDDKLPNYAYPSLIAAMEVSTNDLPEEVRKQYLDLAVFPEDTAIPESALGVLWGLEGKGVRKIASQLVNRSLATRDTTGRLTLHDLQVDYVRKRSDAVSLHNRLLAAYWQRCSGAWDSGPNDGYFFEYLPYHLKHAGRAEELRNLLLDFDWLQRKLEHTGVTGVLSDYNLLPTDATLHLLQGAIRLSAHAVRADPAQLAGQLLGRLLHVSAPEIAALSQRATRWQGNSWLKPVYGEPSAARWWSAAVALHFNLGLRLPFFKQLSCF